MPSRPFLALLLLLASCRAHSAPPPAAEAAGAFDAASGVVRGDTNGRAHRIIPLRRMSGDVEILYGDPEKAGEPFVMRIQELPGSIIPLHSHPVDEHITVVEGTWYFAVGERWDSTALGELTAGTYAFAPAGSTMYGASPDGAVVQVHGVGPFHIHWKDGLTTLDDPAPAPPPSATARATACIRRAAPASSCRATPPAPSSSTRSRAISPAASWPARATCGGCDLSYHFSQFVVQSKERRKSITRRHGGTDEARRRSGLPPRLSVFLRVSA